MIAEIHVRAPVEVGHVLDPDRHERRRLRVHRRGGLFDAKRSAVERHDIRRDRDRLLGHPDTLAREPRDAFLHEVPAQEVGPDSAREREVRLDLGQLAGGHVRGELRPQTIPHDGLAGAVDPVIAQGHGVRTGRGPGEVAGVAERDRHGGRARGGPAHREDRVVRAE